jgi:hypothetical protein
MNERNEFLLSSIGDIQGTIRAMDTKLIGILIFLMLPLSHIGKIFFYCKHALIIYCWHCPFCFIATIALIILFCSSWLLTIITALKGISAIDNPSSHLCQNELQEENFPKGVFYNGDLFRPNILDILKNRPSLKSSISIKKQLDSLPVNEDPITIELLFEQNKLVYIRSIKIIRQKWCFILLEFFIFTGCLLWIIDYCSCFCK